MSSATGSLILASCLCLTLPTLARAQSQPAPGAATVMALPDVVWRAVVGRLGALQMTDGSELKARIVSFTSELLIVSVDPSAPVVTVPRASVTGVRLLLVPPLPARDPAAEPPRRQRHVGLNLSIAPGFDLDLDAGWFHGFANLGITLPMGTNGGIIPVALGLGAGIPLSRDRALRLDLFAHLNVIGKVLPSTYLGFGNRVAFGAGLGLHYTWRHGLTMGFTLPIMGYAIDVTPSSAPDSASNPQGVGSYFLSSFEALPLGFIGYRI